MKNLRFLIILVSTLLFSNVYSQSITLANSGYSSYKIIIPHNSDKSESLAASEFQRYFKNITGVELAIENNDNLEQKKSAILIGAFKRFKNLGKVENDGVIIKTEDSNLIIAGGDNRGVLYGVYTFFEKYLECRFFALDELKIPKKKIVKISAIDYRYSPPFNFRSYYSLENDDKKYADFNKQNYFFENRLYSSHSLAWLLPASKYFATNPDFFALIDGKRNPSQICFSSKAALNELIKVLKIEISLTPNHIWSVSHLDTPLICHCDLCETAYKKGNGFSETLIPFVNKIARAFPDKTISTLAYNQSLLPSKLEKPEKNVEIMFCFTQTDQRYPIFSSHNLEAKKYLNAFGQWKTQTNNFFVWDYSVNYFHSLYPFPNIHTFQQNIQYFRTLGVKKVFIQGIGLQKGEFSELKSYLASQLLWNPDTNFQLLMDDFLKNYYGNAWNDIKNYLQLLEKESKKYNTSLNVYASPSQYAKGYLSSSNIAKYRSILENAQSKVKNDQKFANRIKKEMLSLEYAEIEMMSAIVKNLNIKTKSDFNKKLKKFETESQRLKVEKLRNGELTVEEFVKQKTQ